ncbi:SET domain-containing protein [Panus rudis PR-1116 ss-1]|nr:SET domain-containing protein [Panus rudis PR-1116 ss-1]
MVATRRINRAELIVAERPVYAARRSLSCAADQSNANGVFYRAALEGLSEEARMAILQLHNAYPRASVDYVPGILNTNCLEIQVVEKQDPAESYVGCFPTLSRVNHDCTPSAHYFFDFGRFEGQLRAMRNIEEGEEITMTYTDVCLPFVERQNFLARTRYFTCRCRACCLTGQEKEASEARRAAIADITNRLDTVRFPEEVPYERLQAVLDGAREEGLVHQYAQVLMLGSQVLTIYGDLRIAIDWAQRAKQLFVMIEGESSPNVKTLTEAERVHRAMVNAPRSMRLPRLS